MCQRAWLSDGSEETADFIIVGIGIIPNTELAETAGLACDQGFWLMNTAVPVIRRSMLLVTAPGFSTVVS